MTGTGNEWGKPFLGRLGELAALRAASSKLEPSGRLVLLTGEAGIGKTRLIEQFTASLSSATRTLWGRCHRDPDVPSYWPWLAIVEAHAERRDDTTLLEELGDGAAELVPLIPALAARFPDFAAPPELDPTGARLRLFEASHGFLRRAAAGAPIVAVFEDVHWVDGPTLALLEHLVSDLSGLNVLFLVSYRALHLAEGSEAASQLGALERYGEKLLLGGLDEPEVAQLMSALSGQVPPSVLSRAMHARTRGNPLFIEQMSRLIGSHQPWDATAVERVHVPTEIHTVVRGRVARLPERARRVLSMAAVVGMTFELDVLTRAADESTESLLASLEAPLAARLVEKVPRTLREYGFTHALIRDVLYEDLGVLDRGRAHERTARAILSAHERDVDAHLPSLAHHFYQAAEVCAPAPVVEFCSRAGDSALLRHAYDAAAAHFQRALHAVSLGASDEATRGRLLLRLGECERHSQKEVEARAAFAKAVEIGERTDDAELLGWAALRFAGAMNSELGQIDVEAMALMERALARVDRTLPVLRARLLARLVHEQWFVLPRDAARALLDEALALAEASSDPNALAHVHNVRHLALWDDDVDARIATAEKIVALRGRAETGVVLEGYTWLLTDELERGDAAAWERIFNVLGQYAKEVRQPLYLSFVEVRVVSKKALEGRLDEVEEPIFRGLSTEPMQFRLGWMLTLLAVRRDQGRLAELEDMVRMAAAVASSMPAARYMLAFELAAAGATDAELAYGRIAGKQFADTPSGLQRLITLAMSVEACCAVGNTHDAEALRAILLPLSDRHVQLGNGLAYWDSVAHLLGMLAIKLERWDEAQAHLGDALRRAQAIGAAGRGSHIQLHLAQALLGRGDVADAARITTLIDSASATAARIGLTGLLPRLEAFRSRVDDTFARKPARPDRVSAFSSKFGLTPAQRRVFAMLVEGLSPKEIAAHLRISHSTVRRHAEDIHRKCGMTSQRETLALFARTTMELDDG